MKKKKQYCILCPVLVVLWLFPVFYGGFSGDMEYIKALVAYLLLLVAVLLCWCLPKYHAALLSAAAVGAGLCLLLPSAVYDILPVLLLCCWLRCWKEYKKGNTVSVYIEFFTDLIYASLVAGIIRLFRFGYSFLKIQRTDIHSISDLSLAALVFLSFIVLFIIGTESHIQPTNEKNENLKRARGAGRRYFGIIPISVSLRSFWGFCVLLFLVSLLQATDSALIPETTLFFRSGFRLLLLPWMVLVFVVLNTVFPDFAFRNYASRK